MEIRGSTHNVGHPENEFPASKAQAVQAVGVSNGEESDYSVFFGDSFSNTNVDQSGLVDTFFAPDQHVLPAQAWQNELGMDLSASPLDPAFGRGMSVPGVTATMPLEKATPSLPGG